MKIVDFVSLYIDYFFTSRNSIFILGSVNYNVLFQWSRHNHFPIRLLRGFSVLLVQSYMANRSARPCHDWGGCCWVSQAYMRALGATDRCWAWLCQFHQQQHRLLVLCGPDRWATRVEPPEPGLSQQEGDCYAWDDACSRLSSWAKQMGTWQACVHQF